jgi:hypothetical protein
MNHRPNLIEAAEAYRTGLIEGRKQGIAMERSRVRKVEWSKLFGIVVAGSTIGCGIILAVAVGLSHL